MGRKSVDRILEVSLVILMATMTINVLWQVASRFVFDEPSAFTDELARYLMIWTGILGAAYVAGKNMHVKIDVFVNRRSETFKKRANIVVKLIIIVFSLIALVLGGARLVYITYVLGQNSPALQVPLSLVYIIIPISGIIIVYYKVLDLIQPTNA